MQYNTSSYNRYKKTKVNQYIEFPRDLLFLKPGDVFHVRNGQWYGKIESHTSDGRNLTISMYEDLNDKTPVRDHVSYAENSKLDWTIDAVLRPISEKEVSPSREQDYEME